MRNTRTDFRNEDMRPQFPIARTVSNASVPHADQEAIRIEQNQIRGDGQICRIIAVQLTSINHCSIANNVRQVSAVRVALVCGRR